MKESETKVDPLSFEAMREDRAVWEHCQVTEYHSLIHNRSATLGAAIATRTRLENLLLAVLKASAKDLPAVQAEFDETPDPKLYMRIELCKKHGLIERNVVRTMHLLRKIGNAFAHDGVLSAIEPCVAPLFVALRTNVSIPADQTPADDVRLIAKAFERSVSGVRDWRKRTIDG